MRFQQGWAGTDLISRSRILPGTAMEANKHDKMDEKAIDGWFQFDYVLDLAKGTETQYIVIGW